MKDIKLILEEIENHLEFVKYDRDKILEIGLNIELLKDKDFVILLDAFIFRFIKLQSSISEKLFPLLFEILTGKEHTEATFIDILNTLEKYKIIPSADYWRRIRKLRNEFVHVYSWEEEIKLEALKIAIEEVKNIENILKNIKVLIEKIK